VSVDGAEYDTRQPLASEGPGASDVANASDPDAASVGPASAGFAESLADASLGVDADEPDELHAARLTQRRGSKAHRTDSGWTSWLAMGNLENEQGPGPVIPGAFSRSIPHRRRAAFWTPARP
jgi:hypothetical protein